MLSNLARDPGWEMRADIPADVKRGEKTTIRFFLVDRAGQPVVPDGVTFFAYRPSDSARDFNADMVEEGEGRYRVDVSFPLIGVWDTLVSVRQGEEEYNLAQRVYVQHP